MAVLHWHNTTSSPHRLWPLSMWPCQSAAELILGRSGTEQHVSGQRFSQGWLQTHVSLHVLDSNQSIVPLKQHRQAAVEDRERYTSLWRCLFLSSCLHFTLGHRSGMKRSRLLSAFSRALFHQWCSDAPQCLDNVTIFGHKATASGQICLRCWKPLNEQRKRNSLLNGQNDCSVLIQVTL